MPKFKIFYDYTMAGEIVVEADNLESAITKVDEMEDIPKGVYVDSSFTINREVCYALNSCPNYESGVKCECPFCEMRKRG